MRTIKILALVMGGLIVTMTVMLIVAALAVNSRDDAPPYAGSISLPQGASVDDIVIDGDRIVVRAELPDGRSRLIVIDARTGRSQGVVDLRTGR